MKQRTVMDVTAAPDDTASTELESLLNASVSADPASVRTQINGVVVGTLVGLTANSARGLVIYPGQPGSAALPADSLVDLHDTHIGRRLVMMFEDGDPLRPVIMGCLKPQNERDVSSTIGQIEVEADGERLSITASRQLVLRCGKASITLTCDGKILVHGTYVSNRSSGVMRIKGGSVQIN